MDFDFNLTGNLKIMQNVNNALARTIGTLPFNRGKGISNSYIDAPQNTIEAKMAVEVVEELEREESRYTVESVDFEYDDNGKITPTLNGVIDDES
jgi:phage baseplate assembly protein W